MTPTAIVTGAARGIGAAIASKLIADGHQVLLVDLSDEVAATARRLAAEQGGEAVGLALDITAPDAPDRVLGACGDDIDVLVNNAGITRDALVEKMEAEAFADVLNVNLGAAIALSEAVEPKMREGAAIVNVSSKSANGNFGQFNYAVSKAGLIGLTRSFALRLAPRGIRVNAIAPAFTHTEMTDAIPADVREKVISRIPMGRGAAPEEIADVVVWLASEHASYVTGQVVAACGGRSFG